MSGVNFNSSNYGAYNNRPPSRPSSKQFLEDVDTDNSGTINFTEFSAFQPPSIDGQSPPALTDEMKQKFFTKLDTDGDGQVTQTDLEAAPPPGPRGPNGQGMDPQQLAAMQQHRELVDQAFSQYGLNGQDIFKEVRQASGNGQPLPPDQMDAALTQVLQNHGLSSDQIETLLNQIRPPAPQNQ